MISPSETEITSEPEAKDWSITAVVADPEENERAYLAFSRAATAVSKLCRFGLELLLYS